jgi:hypothetical protein
VIRLLPRRGYGGANSCVVHQYVNLPEGLNRRIDHGGALFRLADIAADGHSAAADGLYLPLAFLQTVDAPACEHEVRTGLGQRLSKGDTEARGRTRDDDDLPV